MKIILITTLIALLGCMLDSKKLIQKQIKLMPKGAAVFEIDSGHFLLPNTVMMHLLPNGKVLTYDIASRELILSDSSGKLIRHYRDVIDKIGKYYSIITDVSVDCTGNILLINHQKGEASIIDTNSALVIKQFTTQSTTWFNILPYSRNNYLFYSSARMSKMPTIFIYDSSGHLTNSFGEMENEVIENQYALHSAGRQVATDTDGNIYAVHPAFYCVQKYNSSGKKVKVFRRPNGYWQQLMRQNTDIPDKIHLYSIVELLATTDKYVLIFAATNKDEVISQRWLDVYDFDGNHLATLETKLNEKPVCVTQSGNIWFANADSLSKNVEQNDKIWIQKYLLTKTH